MHLIETFAVKLLQIVVSDMSSKKVPARILLMELTKIINFSRLNVAKKMQIYDVTNPQGFFCQSKADLKCKQQLVLLKTIYSLPSFLLFVLLPYQWQLATVGKPSRKEMLRVMLTEGPQNRSTTYSSLNFPNPLELSWELAQNVIKCRQR